MTKSEVSKSIFLLNFLTEFVKFFIYFSSIFFTYCKKILKNLKIHSGPYSPPSLISRRIQVKYTISHDGYKRTYKEKHLSKGENFFFTHAITILSLFAYSVYDEKVKNR